MKIAFILPSLANKAPVLVAKEIIDGLIKKNIEVKVFYLKSEIDLSFGCPTKQLTLNTIFEPLEFDIVHSHMFRPDLISMLLKFFCKKKASHISTIHSIYDADLKNSYSAPIAFFSGLIWLFSWRIIKNLVVLNKHSFRFYNSKLRRCNIVTINNGRNIHIPKAPVVTDESKLLELRRSFRVIGACAGVSKIKGFEQVLKVLPSLPNYCFVLVGDGPDLHQLISLANTLGVSDRFIPFGYKPNSRDYLPYFDIFIMSSRSEGMPLALIEAVAARVPTICSKIDQLKEIFTSSETCFFEIDSTHSLQEAVATVESNPSFYVDNAYLRYQLNYSAKTMTDNYLKVYLDLLSEHQSQSTIF